MNATLKKFLSAQTQYTDRHELSIVLEMTVDQVRRNEKNLGIDGCKVKLNSRFVRYWRTEAIGKMREKGIMPATTALTAQT